jgi:hypothetical protein
MIAIDLEFGVSRIKGDQTENLLFYRRYTCGRGRQEKTEGQQAYPLIVDGMQMVVQKEEMT